MKANTIRDVAYVAATVNNALFHHYRGSLLCIGQNLRIIFIPHCHNKSFDDVTAALGPLSLYARMPLNLRSAKFSTLENSLKNLKKATATILSHK